MSKGARTVVELEREVALLKTRDARRSREMRALRGDLDAIERMLARDHDELGAAINRNPPLPATNSTPLTPIRGATAGTALRKVRLFLRRWLP